MANQALYLKWRPQGFEDVIGQDHITRTLRNALRQERIRHAYLFSGPRGTGKTSNARLLAKAVNCLHPDSDRRPCNECHHCRMVNEGRFLDLIEIDAASHTGVDDVRDLRDKIAFTPSQGQYKVYIIDEVHRFSTAAFDALLKTLEEPPDHAIFILATTELEKVPATIKSRCLLFEFRRVPLRQLIERLALICEDEGTQIDPAALELIARQGTGSVRDSISLLDQVVADPEQYISFELAQRMLGVIGSDAVEGVVQAIIENNAAMGLDHLNEAIDRGADPHQLGIQIVEHLRGILLVKMGGVGLVDASDDQRARFQEQAKHINRATILKAIHAFSDAVQTLRSGWQPQLPLELALVESVQPQPEPQIISTAPPPPVAAVAAVAAPQSRPSASPATSAEAEASPPSVNKGAVSPAASLSLQTIINKWPQLLAFARGAADKSLYGQMAWARPYRLEGDTLQVTMVDKIAHKFQKRIPILEELLQQVYKTPLKVHLLPVTSEQFQSGQGISTDFDSVNQEFANEIGAKLSKMD